MQFTKFQGNRLQGSGGENNFKVFTVYGHGGHHGHVTWIKVIKFLGIFA